MVQSILSKPPEFINSSLVQTLFQLFQMFSLRGDQCVITYQYDAKELKSCRPVCIWTDWKSAVILGILRGAILMHNWNNEVPMKCLCPKDSSWGDVSFISFDGLTLVCCMEKKLFSLDFFQPAGRT